MTAPGKDTIQVVLPMGRSLEVGMWRVSAYRAALDMGRATEKGMRLWSCRLQYRAALPNGRALEVGMIELRSSSWYQSCSSYRESARERGAAQELSLQYRAALPMGRALEAGMIELRSSN